MSIGLDDHPVFLIGNVNDPVFLLPTDGGFRVASGGRTGQFQGGARDAFVSGRDRMGLVVGDEGRVSVRGEISFKICK